MKSATNDVTADSAVTLSLSLVAGAAIVEKPQGVSVEMASEMHRPHARFEQVTPGQLAVLRTLEGEGASMALLAARMLEHDGPGGFLGFQRALALLDRCSILSRTLFVENTPIASLHPSSMYYRHDSNRVLADTRYTLSRFACCRKDGRHMTIESPLGHAVVRLHSGSALAALGALSEPRTSAEVSELVAGLSEPAARELMNLIANTGSLVTSADGALVPEDANPTLAQWEFHDLFFHTRSRLGRHANPYGGTYRFKGRIDELPAVKPPMSQQVVALERPDLERLSRDDRPFSAVLEARRSSRQQGDTPISLAQLGEFLFRAARVQKLIPQAGVSFRPSPAGGALHELELYPIVHRCDGLEPALYRYDPFEHRLEVLPSARRQLDILLQMATITSEMKQPPQVVLIVTARFQRMQWKYQSMAYNVILKNVGALYQTMYLVATAMGLAPCGMGGGHSDLFAEAAGLEYLAETSVGEFILGSAHA